MNVMGRTNAGCWRAAAHTRYMRDLRRDKAVPRRTPEEMETERADAGVPTRASERMQLPRAAQLRAKADYVDQKTGLLWTRASRSQDGGVFGVRMMRGCTYSVGDIVGLHDIKNDTDVQPLRGIVKEIQAQTKTMYIIAVQVL